MMKSKPFSPKELVARIHAVLRRTKPIHDVLSSADHSIQVLRDQHQVTVEDKAVQLTPTEYRLLVLFMENPTKVFSRNRLAESLFGWDYEGYEETIYVHVKNLRKKLEQYTSKKRIHTVYGVGYRWDDG